VSYAETRYAPCACSPLGKVERVSQPYAPGTSEANKVWTVYTYDALGRTLTGSNRACVTNCLYQANTVNVTDRAGRWKKQVFDAFGNLVQVVEQAESGDTRRLATRAKLGFPPEKRSGYQGSEWASVSPVSGRAACWHARDQLHVQRAEPDDFSVDAARDGDADADVGV
jgi:hypothetical protein